MGLLINVSSLLKRLVGTGRGVGERIMTKMSELLFDTLENKEDSAVQVIADWSELALGTSTGWSTFL